MGHRPKLGSYGKNRIFGPKTEILGQKFWFLVQKSDFCHTTPILVNDPFLALCMTVNFPPWDRFFDFPFWSYSSFRKKKSGWHVKNSSPSSLLGHCRPVTALALSVRRPFGPARFADWIMASTHGTKYSQSSITIISFFLQNMPLILFTLKFWYFLTAAGWHPDKEWTFIFIFGTFCGAEGPFENFS